MNLRLVLFSAVFAAALGGVIAASALVGPAKAAGPCDPRVQTC